MIQPTLDRYHHRHHIVLLHICAQQRQQQHLAFICGAHLAFPSARSDWIQGEGVAYSIFVDQLLVHRRSSFAKPEYLTALLSIVTILENRSNDFKDITTNLKRFDRGVNAPVVTIDSNYSLIFGYKQPQKTA